MAHTSILEMCVHLNQLISHALHKHNAGDQQSLQARDSALELAKVILTEYLDGLPKTQNMQGLIDLQGKLAKILDDINIYDDDIPLDLLVLVNRLISEALAIHSRTENMELLIHLNKEISSALVESCVTVRREKLLGIMSTLSSKTVDSSEKSNVIRPLFRLKDVLLETLAENSEEKKRDLLLKLNILLGAYMVSNHSGKSTDWVVKLNYYAALAMVKNFGDQTQLNLMNQYIANAIRRIPPAEAIFKDLTQLNFLLSRIMMISEVPRKHSLMIEWKLNFSEVMPEAIEGSGLRSMDDQGSTIFRQVTLAEIACLKAQLFRVMKERDFLKEELMKINPSIVAIELDATVQRDTEEAREPVDLVQPVDFREVSHLRLVLRRYGEEEEEVNDEVTRKQERIVAGGGRGQDTSSQNKEIPGKDTEIVEKRTAEKPGQQNTETPAANQTEIEKTADEIGAMEEEEKRGSPKVDKKAKRVLYTYALPPRAKKDFTEA